MFARILFAIVGVIVLGQRSEIVESQSILKKSVYIRLNNLDQILLSKLDIF
jgi:hypothetical protein